MQISFAVATSDINSQNIDDFMALDDYGKVTTGRILNFCSTDSKQNSNFGQNIQTQIAGSKAVGSEIVSIPETIIDEINREINLSKDENVTIYLFQEKLDNGVIIIGAAASPPVNSSSTPRKESSNISSLASLTDWKFAKEIGSQSEEYPPKRVTSVFSKNDYVSWLLAKY